jgi:hypothetical protein
MLNSAQNTLPRHSVEMVHLINITSKINKRKIIYPELIPPGRCNKIVVRCSVREKFVLMR